MNIEGVLKGFLHFLCFDIPGLSFNEILLPLDLLCIFSLEMSVTRHKNSLIPTINRSSLSFALDVVIVVVIVVVVVVTLRSFDHLKHSFLVETGKHVIFSYIALNILFS